MTLETTIKGEFLDYLQTDIKKLTVKDVKSDLHWLYKINDQSNTNPKIIITYSPRKYKKAKKDLDTFAKDDHLGLKHEMEYICYMEYLKRDRNEKISEDINRYINFIKKGIWQMSLYDNVVIILQRPKKIIYYVRTNESWNHEILHSIKEPSILWQNGEKKFYIHGELYGEELFNEVKDLKLTYTQVHSYTHIQEVKAGKVYHSLKKPAVVYENRKTEYWIHGVRFSKQIWNRVKDRKLPVVKVLAIRNIEQRYVSLRLYGIDRVMKECKSKLIDKSKRGNELYEVELGVGRWSSQAITAKALKYKCPSTDRIYLSFVEDKYIKADQAMASKYQITLEEYAQLRIEA